MASLVHSLLAATCGERRVKGHLTVTRHGRCYTRFGDTQVCGTVTVEGGTWARALFLAVAIPISVTLDFKPVGVETGRQFISTTARCKADMDESTTTVVRPGSVREVILATLKGGLVFPGSEDVGAMHLAGDWDLDVLVANTDTQKEYMSKALTGFIRAGCVRWKGTPIGVDVTRDRDC